MIQGKTAEDRHEECREARRKFIDDLLNKKINIIKIVVRWAKDYKDFVIEVTIHKSEEKDCQDIPAWYKTFEVITKYHD